MNSIEDLGYNPVLDNAFFTSEAAEYKPARVAIVERGRYLLLGLGDPIWATAAGALRHHAIDPLDLPAVGDWVAVKPGTAPVIQSVLPRTSCFVRKAVGSGNTPQVVATNIDRVLVVTAVGADFSPRRIERYLAAVWDSGAEPIVVVNKTDLDFDWAALTRALRSCAAGVPVTFVSAQTEGGLAELLPYCEPRMTLALVGSSGVGKSTITNRLLGREIQETQGVREGDDKGRHTTTRRELFVTPDGALIIDTPGMREFGLWQADSGVSETFADVETLAGSCRFRDCSHQGEPGCAVLKAIDDEVIDPSRLSSYNKLQREVAYEERRADPRVAANTKKRWKVIHKNMRARHKVMNKTGHKV